MIGDRGLADQHPVGRVFYGRLVQVDGDPRWWFATLPVVLEPACVPAAFAALAADVGPPERLVALAESLRAEPDAMPAILTLDDLDGLDDVEGLADLDEPF